MAQVVAFGSLPLPAAVGGAGAQLCLKQRCSEASRWSARTPAPQAVGAGSASHAWHGAGHEAILLLLPLAVGVGRGQFRQPADSGRLLHHAPPVPQLLRRESPLQQTPGPHPRRPPGAWGPRAPSSSLAQQKRGVLAARVPWPPEPCRERQRKGRAGWSPRVCQIPSGRAGAVGCRMTWDLAHCVNTVTTGEMFSLRRHLSKFSCC